MPDASSESKDDGIAERARHRQSDEEGEADARRRAGAECPSAKRLHPTRATRLGLGPLLGLIGCASACSAPQTLAPVGEPLPSSEEPSGREPGASGPPRVADVDPSRPPSQAWCNTVIDTRRRPLTRTRSFLLAWNEIGSTIRPAAIPRVQLDEHDARLAICHAADCRVREVTRVEIFDAGQLALGALVPDPDGMLVVAGLAPRSRSGAACPGGHQLRSESIAGVLHLWTEPNPPVMFHHYEGESMPYYGGGCYSIEGRRDVFIDVEAAEILAIIEHVGAPVSLHVHAQEERLHIELRGCEQTLDLVWT